jgi:hypothetical protein
MEQPPQLPSSMSSRYHSGSHSKFTQCATSDTSGLFLNEEQQPIDWTRLTRADHVGDLMQPLQRLEVRSQTSTLSSQVPTHSEYDPLERPCCASVSLPPALDTNSVYAVRENPPEENLSTLYLPHIAPLEHTNGTSRPIALARTSSFNEAGGFSENGGSSLSDHVHTTLSFYVPSVSQDLKSRRFDGVPSASSIPTDFNPSAMLSKKKETKSVCGTKAFGPHSSCANEALAHYLDLINCSLFKWLDLPEPTLNHEEGRGLLEKISYLPGCPLVPERYRSRSIFILLVDCATKKCLICGVMKGTLERAIGCVRAHLNHRPFICGGNADGCLACDKSSA